MNTMGATDRSAAMQDAVSRNQAAMRAMAAGDLVGAEAALLHAVGIAQNYLPDVRRMHDEMRALKQQVKAA